MNADTHNIDVVSVSPIKVLIADDDAPTRMLLRAAISQWGYEVIEANDGEEAWDIIVGASPPWLLILDWLMPKLDGPALCAKIKKELQHYPYIILLTQLSGTTNIVKGLESGADEFLQKPFNMAELKSRLSVGARIVRYENELAEQNLKLLNFLNYVAQLSKNILSFSDKLKTLKKFEDKFKDQPEYEVYLKFINSLEEESKQLAKEAERYKNIETMSEL